MAPPYGASPAGPWPARIHGWGRAAFTPPKALDLRVRWLFLVFAALNAALVLLQIASDPSIEFRAVAALADVLLLLIWAHAYRACHFTIVEDVLTLPLLLALGVALGYPSAALGIFFAGLFFSVQYNSTPRAVARGATYAIGLLGVAAATAVVTGIFHNDTFLQAIMLCAGGAVMRALSTALRANQSANAKLSEQARIVDELSESVIVCDAQARLLSWNPATERLLAVSARDLEGTTLDDVLGPGFSPLDGDAGGHVPSRSVQRGPKLLEVAVLSKRDTEGGLKGFIVVTQDRSAAQQAERADQSTQRAVDANRAKTEFLSRMGHELRTPLNAVMGFAQLLEAEEEDEERREFVQQIIGGGQRLLSLIDDLIDVSRIESGPKALTVAVVSVEEVVRRCLDVTALQASHHNIQVHFSTTEFGSSVLANKRGLEQIILNLLTNAIKYNRPGGSVELTSEESAPGFIRLSVVDTGLGIASADLRRLFQPFERLQAEGSEIEGTGLGLLLSQELAEAMGSHIAVESSASGSTFRLDLPRVSRPQDDTGMSLWSAGGRLAVNVPPVLRP